MAKKSEIVPPYDGVLSTLYLSFKSLLYGATFPPTHLVDFIRRGEHRGGAGFSQFYPDIPSLLGARVCVCFFYYLKKIFLLFSLSLSLSTITILPYSFLFLYLSVYVRVRAYVCECVSTLEITLIESWSLFSIIMISQRQFCWYQPTQRLCSHPAMVVNKVSL